MTCLITGCVAFNGHAWVGGDLHQIGDCYVFNAICPTGRSPLWGARHDWVHYDKEVDFSGCEVFERRGVLIAKAASGILNDIALEYLS